MNATRKLNTETLFRVGEWTSNPLEHVAFLTEHVKEPKAKWYVLSEDFKSKRSYTRIQLLAGKGIGEGNFISLLPFMSKNHRIDRTTEYVAENSLIWCDLDMEFAESMDFIAFELDKIPIRPSMVHFSGNGCWLAWRTEPMDIFAWNAIMKRLNYRFKDFKSDRRAIDRARVHRLAGTQNGGNTVQSMILTEDIYTQEAFREYLGLTEESLKPKNTVRSKRPKRNTENKVRMLPTLYHLNCDRVADLLKWAELREYDLTGCRNEYLHILSIYVKKANMATTKDGLMNTMQEINKTLTEPLGMGEIRKIVNSTMRKKYDYKNETIIERLGIALEEQVEFSTIIGAEEKRRRNTIAKRAKRGGVSKEEYQAQFEEKANREWNLIMEVVNSGVCKISQNKQIASLTNLSIDRVKTLKKRFIKLA